jgi:F-box/leucine-rich repeat protein 2/20
MAQSSTESVVLETTAAGPSASIPPAVPIQIQKVKGRKRFIQSLQRMSSSSSLAKLSRSPSSSYRTGGRGSVSCISLSGSGSSYGNSLASELSVGYSTAPTSAATTPGIPFPSFDEKTARSRYLNTVPVPDFRTTTRIAEEDDYFSIPVNKAVQNTKSSFNFWKDLPSELAMEVLSYLEPREVVRCSAVSKQWHSNCFDGLTFTAISLPMH